MFAQLLQRSVSRIAHPSQPILRVQADTTRPLMVGRTAAGFTLNVIDTPGLLDGDYVNQRALNQVARFIEGRAIHAVLYVDRLDLWRVDKTDKAVFEAMTATLGAGVWEHTMLALTHGQMPPPEGMPCARTSHATALPARQLLAACVLPRRVHVTT